MSLIKNSLRNLARHAYYYGNAPTRPRLRAHLAAEGRSPLCVLFYHRVADTHPNGWSMTNAQFERQMRWLKENVEIVTLREIQERLQRGVNDKVAVAITFDDGYAENCERAIPFLLENQIPATYFVSLDFILRGQPFPQDVEAGVELSPNTPEQIRQMAEDGIEIGGHTRTHCDVGAITDPDVLVDEVVTASHELGELVGRPIEYFAFPYGTPAKMSRAAVDLAKQAGLRGVCSAFGAYNFPGQDPYHIRRIHGDPEFIRLKNWLTIDRRKLNDGTRFEFRETGVQINGSSPSPSVFPNLSLPNNPAFPMSTNS